MDDVVVILATMSLIYVGVLAYRSRRSRHAEAECRGDFSAESVSICP
jgi:hypothetical protein